VRVVLCQCGVSCCKSRQTKIWCLLVASLFTMPKSTFSSAFQHSVRWQIILLALIETARLSVSLLWPLE